MREIDPQIDQELRTLRSQLNQSKINLQNEQSLHEATRKAKTEDALEIRDLQTKLKLEFDRAENAQKELDKVRSESKDRSVREINLNKAYETSKEKRSQLESENSKLQRGMFYIFC